MRSLVFWLILASPTVQAGNEVGNGGDHLRILFVEAKSDAVRALTDAAAEPPAEGDGTATVRLWIKDHAARLAEDVAESPLQWVETLPAACEQDDHPSFLSSHRDHFAIERPKATPNSIEKIVSNVN